jgi:glucosamine-6-phosphate deaminase
MLELSVFSSQAAASRFVASLVVNCVTNEPSAVLGVATGSTPAGVYRTLTAHRGRFSRVTAYALDEYVGLPSRHPESFASVLDRDITMALGLSPDRVHVPNGMAANLDREAMLYESRILNSGGIDLQLLGIGRNGHIAFNEPGSAHDSRTRVVTLTEQTRTDNSRFFASLHDVPRLALTQGIGTILEARQLVVMAFGDAKARAVAEAVCGPVSESSPASAVRRHSNVMLVLDLAAASLLENRSEALKPREQTSTLIGHDEL